MMNTEPQAKAQTTRWVLWGLVALFLTAFALLSFAAKRPLPKADSYASAFGGAFTLVDPKGRQVSDQTLRGKPFAIFFGFTRCPDVCPTTLSEMTQLRKRMGADGNKFNIVFVSVDPERDTPADIGTYLTLFDTPIMGLSGSAEQIATIVKAYRIFYKKVPIDGSDYTIDHTATIFLMGREGQFVSSISYDEDAEVALQKLRGLIA